MEVFEKWLSQQRKNLGLNYRPPEGQEWRAALEWVLEKYKHRKDMELLGYLVPFQDAIKKELEEK